MISCSKCGTLNRDGSKFCNNCGERLRTASGGTTMLTNGIICPKCGTLNRVENVFCSNCGTHLLPLSGSGQSDKPSAPPIKGLSLPTKSTSPSSPDETAVPIDAAPGEQSAPEEAAPTEPGEPVASQYEIPDWLARLRAAPPESEAEELSGEAPSSDQVPDWIRALQQTPDETAAESSGAQETAESGEIIEPSTPFELPAWIEQLPTDAESELPNPLESDQDQTSPFPSEAPTRTVPLSGEAATDEDTTVASADEFAAQLESAESFTEPTDETPQSDELSEIPDWLRMAAGTRQALAAEGKAVSEDLAPADQPTIAEQHAVEGPTGEQTAITEPAPVPAIPPWLAALKPESVEQAPTGPGSAEPPGFETEPAASAGPLAGLRGVLPLAVAVAEPHLSTKLAKPVEQESAAGIFDAILAEPVPEHETPVTAVKRRQMGFRTWIYLLLALAVVVPFLLPVSLAGSLLSISNVPSATLHDMIEGVPPASTVLVSFDYDPSMTGEMDLVANAIVSDLVRRNVKIIAVSTLETGPQIAQRLLDSAAARGQNYHYGSEYVNLGYLPGHEAGLAQLATTGLPADSRDFVQGRSLDQFSVFAPVKGLQDTQLVIELAGSEEALKSWMEQVQPRARVRIAAGVSASIEPKARAYLGAGQLAAMTSGLIGAARYEILSRSEGLALTSVDAQSAAMLLLVLLVVAGNIVFWLSRARGKA